MDAADPVENELLRAVRWLCCLRVLTRNAPDQWAAEVSDCEAAYAQARARCEHTLAAAGAEGDSARALTEVVEAAVRRSCAVGLCMQQDDQQNWRSGESASSVAAAAAAVPPGEEDEEEYEMEEDAADVHCATIAEVATTWLLEQQGARTFVPEMLEPIAVMLGVLRETVEEGADVDEGTDSDSGIAPPACEPPALDLDCSEARFETGAGNDSEGDLFSVALAYGAAPDALSSGPTRPSSDSLDGDLFGVAAASSAVAESNDASALDRKKSLAEDGLDQPSALDGKPDAAGEVGAASAAESMAMDEASKVAQPLSAGSVKPAAFAMFSRLVPLLVASAQAAGESVTEDNLFGEDVPPPPNAFDPDQAIATLCSSLQNNMLSKADPPLLACLEALQQQESRPAICAVVSPANYLGRWLRCSFAGAVDGYQGVLEIWEWLLEDVGADDVPQPMLANGAALPHLCVALLLRCRSQLLALQAAPASSSVAVSGETELFEALGVSGIAADEAQALIELARTLRRPGLAATVTVTEVAAEEAALGDERGSEPGLFDVPEETGVELAVAPPRNDYGGHDVLVIEFATEGSLGLLLRQLGGAVAVIGFNTVPHPDPASAGQQVPGPARMAGVAVGDELVAINGNALLCPTGVAMASVVSAVGAIRAARHPLFLTFWHASQDQKQEQLRRLRAMARHKDATAAKPVQPLSRAMASPPSPPSQPILSSSPGIQPPLLGGELMLASVPALMIGERWMRTAHSHSRFSRISVDGRLWLSTYRLFFVPDGFDPREAAKRPELAALSWATPLLAIARLEPCKSSASSGADAQNDIVASPYVLTTKINTRTQQQSAAQLQKWASLHAATGAVAAAKRAGKKLGSSSTANTAPRERVLVVTKDARGRQFALPVSGPDGVAAQRLLSGAMRGVYPASADEFFCFRHNYSQDGVESAASLLLPAGGGGAKPSEAGPSLATEGNAHQGVSEENLFGIPGAPAVDDGAVALHRPPSTLSADGWQVYEPSAEFRRLGFVGGAGTSCWRVLDQMDHKGAFWLCPTYPRWLVVPAALTDGELRHAASFRTKHRLIVPTWRNASSGATVSRSAQPKVGIGKKRNRDDEKLVHLLAAESANSQTALRTNASKCRSYIIDCRGKLASQGNMLKGAGTESVDNYKASVPACPRDSASCCTASYAVLLPALQFTAQPRGRKCCTCRSATSTLFAPPSKA
jgi:hypothetical protein